MPKSEARIAPRPYDRRGTSARTGTLVQEQSQIINSVSGRPTPKAPPTVNANAESKLSST
jgi:hypothetical protein